MTIINSVLGPLDTKNLGVTLCHEHLQDSSTALTLNYPELLEPAYKKHIIDGLKRLMPGVSTLSLTPLLWTWTGRGTDGGSFPRFRRECDCNQRLGAGKAPLFSPVSLRSDSLRHLLKIITVGIAGTGIKAGVLKKPATAPASCRAKPLCCGPSPALTWKQEFPHAAYRHGR